MSRIIVAPGGRYTYRPPSHGRHDHIYKNQPVGGVFPGRPERLHALLFQGGKDRLGFGFVVVERGPSYCRASREIVARSTLKSGDAALALASSQPL